MSSHLIVVACEPLGRRTDLVARLRRAGHAVVGTSGPAPADALAPEALVLDAGLPLRVGEALIAQLGADVVVRFEANEPGEVVCARVASSLRGGAPLLRLDVGVADTRRRVVLRGDAVVKLTEREAALLAWLSRDPDRTWPRDVLLREVWGWRVGGETRTVDITVRRLREKVESDPSAPRHILTEVGVGYRWVPAVAPPVDPLPQVDAPQPEPMEEATEIAAIEARLRTLLGRVQERRSPGPGRLPADVSSFVDRPAARRAIHAALDQARLVSLVGPGGAGKTRLGVRVAAERTPSDGAWFVDLAPLLEPGQVAWAVAHALGVADVPGRPIDGVLADHLEGRRALVVLDNCEQVIGAVTPLVSTLLRACPELQVLTTTREALGVPGERVYRVPPLGLPGAGAPLAEVQEAEAVRLFVERARAHSDGFEVTEANAALVGALCTRLDGIPLAIELAAARARALPLEQLVARLDDRLRLLAGPRGVLARHQTLGALVAWSYDLLDERERNVFLALSAFVDGWTLAAAEGICGGDDLAEWEVLDALTTLVDKSLVHFNAEEERYRLLETIRVFAAERLRQSGREPVARERHARWWASCAVELDPQGPEARSAVDRLDAERENIRAAVGWLCANDGADAAETAVQHLAIALRIRGRHVEATELLERLLAGEGLPPGARAKTLVGLGVGSAQRGDFAKARRWLEESLTLRRALGDARGVVNSLFNLGDVLRREGAIEDGIRVMEEAVALGGEQGRRIGLIQNLGSLLFHAGDLRRSRALLEEELALEREAGHGEWESETRCFLARLELAESRHAASGEHLRVAIELAGRLDNKPGILLALFGAALLASATGRHDRAAELLTAHDHLAAETGALLEPVNREAREAVRAAAAAAGIDAPVRRWTWEDACDAVTALVADAARPGTALDSARPP